LATQQGPLQRGALKLGLSLSPAQLHAFEIYSQELITWNRRFNLTRISDPEQIVVKHFLDSLSVYQALTDLTTDFSMVDVGAGAGFPGIPLKIALAEIELTLLEATVKKSTFLQHVLDLLRLARAVVLTARAEEAGQDPVHRERYDVAVARAVATIPVLAEYTLPLIRPGGLVVAQKGLHPAAEVDDAAQALRTLGGELVGIKPVQVPGLSGARHLVIIQKTGSTPKKYPRRSGVPAGKPI
jgi:16S rRNA (guanine527-N7)-methyltransferase